MSDKVDALFAGEPPPPPVDAAAKLRMIRTILWVAAPMNLFGILCWTGVPGAALTLWAWLQTDGEMSSLEEGLYTPDDAARFTTLRNVSAWMLGFCVLSLIAQVFLLTTNFYNSLWSMIIQ